MRNFYLDHLITVHFTQHQQIQEFSSYLHYNHFNDSFFSFLQEDERHPRTYLVLTTPKAPSKRNNLTTRTFESNCFPVAHYHFLALFGHLLKIKTHYHVFYYVELGVNRIYNFNLTKIYTST